MILITGAAGFIAARLAQHLHLNTPNDLLLVDDFIARPDKQVNWTWSIDNSRVICLQRQDLWTALPDYSIEAVFHLGARTDTTLFDKAIFDDLNIGYSKRLWTYCTEQQIPFYYASSAATYGNGEKGYDDYTLPAELTPLNPYGDSKNDFDAWVLTQVTTPPNWAGFKFFNVYGYGESHKGRMASVVWHAYNSIKQKGSMQLFKSHRPDFADGAQSRDFVSVTDVVNILTWFYTNRPQSSIYNLGTGQARPFLDLTRAVFAALQIPENISFIDTPLDIRETYQYFTEARLHKLRSVGYTANFLSLEQGVLEYVSLLQSR